MSRFRSTESSWIRRTAAWVAVLLLLGGGGWMVRAMLMDIRKSVAIPDATPLPGRAVSDIPPPSTTRRDDPATVGSWDPGLSPTTSTNHDGDPPLVFQRMQTDETAPPPESATTDPVTRPEPAAPSTAELAARGRASDLLLEAASKAAAAGDQVARRTHLNAALALLDDSPHAAEIRATLTGLNTGVILGPDVLLNDPYAPLVAIEAGDSFLKIARRQQITVDLLAALNPQLDSNHLRTGAGVKIVRGPFHLQMIKHAQRADLYLRDLYVRSYPMQIGEGYYLPGGTYRIRTEGKIRLMPAAGGRGWIVIGPGGGGKPARDSAGTASPESVYREWISFSGADSTNRDVRQACFYGSAGPRGGADSAAAQFSDADLHQLYNTLVEHHSLIRVDP